MPCGLDEQVRGWHLAITEGESVMKNPWNRKLTKNWDDQYKNSVFADFLDIRPALTDSERTVWLACLLKAHDIDSLIIYLKAEKARRG
jgi:hypothetical protein